MESSSRRFSSLPASETGSAITLSLALCSGRVRIAVISLRSNGYRLLQGGIAIFISSDTMRCRDFFLFVFLPGFLDVRCKRFWNLFPSPFADAGPFFISGNAAADSPGTADQNGTDSCGHGRRNKGRSLCSAVPSEPARGVEGTVPA